MATHFAAHVHAASILLNAVLAFRTLLCVRHDPEVVLRLGGALELPLLQQLAGQRGVAGVSAAEAELGPCGSAGGPCAGDVEGDVGVLGQESHLGAAGGGTPAVAVAVAVTLGEHEKRRDERRERGVL